MWGRKDFLVALYLKPRHDMTVGKDYLNLSVKGTNPTWHGDTVKELELCGPVAAVCSVLSPALTVTLDLGERGVKQTCVEKQVQVGWSAKGWFCL